MIKKLITLFLGFLVILTIANTISTRIITTDSHIANNTVLILGKLGGGSGVTLESSPLQSLVLTNKHICEAIQEEGRVVSDTGQQFSVINFIMSDIHDLCLIKVSGNLNGGVSLASNAPEIYDTAIIAGHPHLIPTVILRGHFAGKQIVNVSGEGKPLEAQFISMLIQPGSSGSPVYNSSGELAGMVFAGQAGIGFGLIVPFEYLNYFLNVELKMLEVHTITPETRAQ